MNTCISCLNWTLRAPAPAPKMLKLGYGLCKHESQHRFFSPAWPACPKFDPAPEDIVQARIDFLNRKTK